MKKRARFITVLFLIIFISCVNVVQATFSPFDPASGFESGTVRVSPILIEHTPSGTGTGVTAFMNDSNFTTYYDRNTFGGGQWSMGWLNVNFTFPTLPLNASNVLFIATINLTNITNPGAATLFDDSTTAYRIGNGSTFDAGTPGAFYDESTCVGDCNATLHFPFGSFRFGNATNPKVGAATIYSANSGQYQWKEVSIWYTIDNIPPTVTTNFTNNSIITLPIEADGSYQITFNINVTENFMLGLGEVGNMDSITEQCLYNVNAGGYESWGNRGACNINSTYTPIILDGFEAISNNTIQFAVYDDAGGYDDTSIYTFSIRTTGFLENSQTYDNITQEGAQNEFKINISYDSENYDNVEATLVYNNSEYPSTRVGTGDQAVFTSTLFAPLVSTDTNISFYWDIALDTDNFNSTTQIQLVQPLDIDDCSSYTNLLLNYTVYDEDTRVFLTNATVETDVNIYTLDQSSLLLSESNNKTNPSTICLNANITSAIGYSLNAITRYYKTDTHVVEFYNIVNATLNSSYGPQHVSLYDLETNQSTAFQVFFTGDDFLPIEGAVVYLDREYVPLGQHLTVEGPITDDDGATVLHLVPSDVRYNIRVVRNQEVIATFNNVVPYCPNPEFTNCQISLASTSALNVYQGYNSLAGLVFSTAPLYNEASNKVTFDFIVPSGLAKTVTLNVTRNDVFGNRTICSNTLTSVSGTLACSIGNITQTSLVSTITVDGETFLVSNTNVNGLTFGSMGIFAWCILTLVLMFVFGDDKNMLLLSLLGSYLGGVLLGFAVGGIIGFGTAGVWILIVTGLAIWRLNKERSQ